MYKTFQNIAFKLPVFTIDEGIKQIKKIWIKLGLGKILLS